MIGRYRLRNRRLASVLALNERLERIGNQRAQALYFDVRGQFRFTVPKDTPLTTPGGIRVPVLTGEVVLRFCRGGRVSAVGIEPGTDKPYRSPLNVGDVATEPQGTGPTLPNGIAEGATSATYSGTTPIVDGWYFLQDRNDVEIHAITEEERRIGGELVQVKSVNTTTHTVELHQAAGRPYRSNAQGGNTILSSTPLDRACVNVGIRNFRGSGIRDIANQRGTIAVINAHYVAGLSLQNCNVTNSYSAGTALQYCRDVTISRHNATLIGDAAGSTGQGYSLQIKQCANSIIRDAWARDARYACQFEAGCTTFDLSRASGNTLIGAAVVDIHGGESYNGTMSMVVGQAGQSVQLGNSSWLRGAKYITLSDSAFEKLRIDGSVVDSNIEDCAIGYVQLASAYYDPLSLLYVPTNIKFEQCNFAGVTNFETIKFDEGNWNQYVNIQFKTCTVTALNTALMTMPNQDDATTISFTNGCTLNAASNSSMMIAEGSSASITFSSCSFHLSSGMLHGLPRYLIVKTLNDENLGYFIDATNGGTTPNTRIPDPANPSVNRNVNSSDTNWNYDSN
ncbi:MAG: hypothetical protein JNM04_01840 [Chthonomonas sp.]|nr:hypothetical protein [Chthonomonas sp.]